MRTFLSVLFACCISLASFAQNPSLTNPGYLGKRTSFSFDLLAMPALGLNSPHTSRRGQRPGLFQSEGTLFLNHNQQFQLERTMSKQLMLGLVFEKIYTGETEYLNGSERHFHINATAFGLGAKLFPFRKKSAMAPLGPYTSFELKVVRGRLLGGDPDRSDFKEILWSDLYPSIAVGFGIQNIIGDAILIRTGVRYAATPFNFLLADSREGEIMKLRLFSHDLMKINLGIGYLF